MDRRTRDLLAYLDRVEPRLGELSHFEMLDIRPGASHADIQRAYHVVATRMHPDHHRAHLTAEQHERLNIVYGRIAEAYRCLRNPREREAYERELAERAPARSDTGQHAAGGAANLLSPKAQRLYRRAQAALRTGDHASAILNLRMALRAAPDSALLKEALAEASAGKRR